jgi:tetratricopeptide (TPR) repeat protein
VEAERAIALNPNDIQNLGYLGNYLAWVGFWDEGAPLAEKALRLSGPTAPRWWWWAIAKRHWVRGEYELALDGFRKACIPDRWLNELELAYTLPFLDRVEEARVHVQRVQKLYPGLRLVRRIVGT